MQTVGFPAVQFGTVLVLDGDQIELTCTQSLDPDVRIRVRQAASIDRIAVWFRVAGLRGLHWLRFRGKHPLRALVERGEARVVRRNQICLRLTDTCVQRLLR